MVIAAMYLLELVKAKIYWLLAELLRRLWALTVGISIASKMVVHGVPVPTNGCRVVIIVEVGAEEMRFTYLVKYAGNGLVKSVV